MTLHKSPHCRMTSRQTSSVARTFLPVAMSANRLLSRAIAMTTTMMATRGDARDRIAMVEIYLMDFSLTPPRNARAGRHSKGVNATWIARAKERVKGASDLLCESGRPGHPIPPPPFLQTCTLMRLVQYETLALHLPLVLQHPLNTPHCHNKHLHLFCSTVNRPTAVRVI